MPDILGFKGYYLVDAIPAGARRIRVEEIQVSLGISIGISQI
jgi:hypothetical protein